MKIKRVFLDTSFLIRLLNQEDPDHANARAYFKRFQKDEVSLLLSTIAMAEYGIGDEINHLPFRQTQVIPFNSNNARLTATFARAAYKARRKGAVALEKRVVIPNDTKLMAQAQEEKADIFITRDDNCTILHNFL
jgi:predicted nucleic acid-binding protein